MCSRHFAFSGHMGRLAARREKTGGKPALAGVDADLAAASPVD
jgi:hypothetical protein